MRREVFIEGLEGKTAAINEMNLWLDIKMLFFLSFCIFYNAAGECKFEAFTEGF